MNDSKVTAKMEHHRKEAGKAARALAGSKLKPDEIRKHAKTLEAAGCYIRRNG